MKPIKFNGVNVIYGKGQDEYLPLPAYKDVEGVVTSCWKLGWGDKFRMLFTGKLWLQQMTFNDDKLQPQRPDTKNPLK